MLGWLRGIGHTRPVRTRQLGEVTMSLTFKRRLLGVVSIALLISAAVLLLGYDGNQTRLFGSAFFRAGLTLSAMWLAFPQVLALSEKFPPRLWLAILLGGMMIVIRPKSLPIVVLIIFGITVLEIAGWVLKPLPGKRNRDR
jgi:hypothetical protein